MALILDGKNARDHLKESLKQEVSSMTAIPTLAIFQIGENSASEVYINQKEFFANSIGAKVLRIKFSEDISTQELIEAIKKENIKKETNGIIVQLPLPKHIDIFIVAEAIDPSKDVDGFSSKSIKSLFSNRENFVPATTKGIISLLDYYEIQTLGKKVCIVGRSEIVGKPTALAFLNRDATVSVCHSKTENLERETKESDILVVAIGRPNFIGKKYVNSNQIIIDVGITRGSEGNLSGDVNFEEVYPLVSAITPVPGGVGPMTVLSLFQNLLEASKKQLV